MPDQNQTPVASSQAETLINIESLINSYYLKLDQLQSKMKEYRQMIDEMLDSNPDYRQISEAVKKQVKEKKIAKQKVMSLPSAQETVSKLKDCSSELKEAKASLSDYLSQYVTLAGTNQIERPDGVLMEVIYQAKLVRKKS